MNTLFIARGSTFYFTINLPEGYDVTETKAIWLTFVQYNKEIFTIEKQDMILEDNHIGVALSQQDTLKFIKGSAEMQLRILKLDDNADVQEPPTKIQILDILKEGEITND